MLVVVLLAVVIHLAYFSTPYVQEIETHSLNDRFLFRGPVDAPAEVVILALDRDTKEKLNGNACTKLDRLQHVRLIERLKQYHVKGVVFDLLFEEPWAEPKTDEKFAKALTQLPTVIVKYVKQTKKDFENRISALSRFPLKIFSDNAQAVANTSMPLDNGVIRRFRIPHNQNFAPTMAEAAASLYGEVKAKPGEFDFINYYGFARSIQAYPYWAILDPEKAPPPDALNGKVVLVGDYDLVGDPGNYKDTWQTPVRSDDYMFGVEVQANAAANIIRGDWIRRLAPWQEKTLLSLLIVLCALLILISRPPWSMVVAGALELGWYLSSLALFSHHFFLPGLIARAVILPFVFAVSLVYYAVQTAFGRSLLYGWLSRLSDKRIAENIALTEQLPTLGGSVQQATALFSDLAHYTKLSEKVGVGSTIPLLNRYYGAITTSARQAGALVLKSSGDSMFALFGEFLGVKNPAQKAIDVALDIQNKLKELIRQGKFIRSTTRVGIHSGEVEVGQVGSEERFDITADGDAVNVGARLEGLNRYFKTTIIASDDALTSAQSQYHSLSLGKVRLKGRKKPVEVHAIWEEPLPVEERETWLKALSLYQEKDWKKARKLFSKLRWSNSRLKFAARLFMGKCSYRLRHRVTPQFKGALCFPHK